MAKKDCETGESAYSSSDLAEYQAELTKLMLADSPAIFANYSRAHARCIIRTFFDSARSSVSVLAGDFGNDFYRLPDVRDALRRAVANGAHVRVISLCVEEHSKNAVIEFRDELNGLNKGTIEVRFGVVRPGAQVKHYMVIDDKRYRLEDVHLDGADAPVHAEVCCNGPGKAAALNVSFNNVWSRLAS